jgi:hypothetical protein
MSMGQMFGIMGMYEDAQQQFGQELNLYRVEHDTTGDGDWQMQIAICASAASAPFTRRRRTL